MKNRDIARTPEALAALQKADRARRERRRGAPGPQPKTKPEGRTRLLGDDGEILAPPQSRSAVKKSPPASSTPGPALQRPAARRIEAVCVLGDDGHPWSYGGARCLTCGGPPVRLNDVWTCPDCGWRRGFNPRAGRWEPK